MFKPGNKIASAERQVEFDEGRHSRAALGFILMSTDLAAEADLFDMAPDDVAVHITRLKTEDHTTTETLARHLLTMCDAASRLQPDVKPDVISYHCTSGSIVNGEATVMDEIRKGAPDSIPMTLVTSVVDALEELQVKKLVVGTPYLDEVNTAEAEFLHNKGFHILDIQGLNLETGLSFGKVSPAYWKKFALEIDRDDADALFLSCTGIRALEVAQDIEDIIDKPVITSNQAQMWSCLRHAGVDDVLEGFGRIFQRDGQRLRGQF